MSSAKIELINQGTYGCVFHPGVACNGSTESTRYVTKIQRNERTIANELSISEKILKIPGYAKYFVPILKKCDVKIRKDNADDLRKCRVFKHHTDEVVEKTSYVSMKIRYVGDLTLGKYILRLPNEKMLSEMLNTHSYLLKGVQKMVEHGIVHNDIRSNNVMYDTTTKNSRPVFIDFGLAFSIDSMKDFQTNLHKIFYVFNVYGFWCIEVVMCNYIFDVVGQSNAKTEIVRIQDLEKIFDVFLHGIEPSLDESRNPKIQNDAFINNILIHPEKMYNFKRVYDQFTVKFIGKTWFETYEELIQYWNTWDSYAIAVVYLVILDTAYAEGTIHASSLNSQIAKTYIELLEDIVYSSPDTRPSLEETKRGMGRLIKER